MHVRKLKHASSSDVGRHGTSALGVKAVLGDVYLSKTLVSFEKEKSEFSCSEGRIPSSS